MAETRKTIALFTSSLVGAYHKDLLLGTSDYAIENDVNLIAYTGGPLRTEHEYLDMRNSIYATVNPDILDGVIIPVSSISRFIKDADFKKFLDLFSAMPIISIGSPFEAIPTVKPDYKSGMINLINHLVTQHNCRRILLIRGPLSHKSSEERGAGYMEAMRYHNLPVIPTNILVGKLIWEEDQIEFYRYIKKNQDKIDAVVTVNDTIALSVMEALLALGIKVPQDIIVMGYQGIEEGEFSHPSLSTVDEMTYRQARQAAKNLMELIQGKEVPLLEYVPTSLVLRESCGCRPSSPALLNAVNQTTREHSSLDFSSLDDPHEKQPQPDPTLADDSREKKQIIQALRGIGLTITDEEKILNLFERLLCSQKTNLLKYQNYTIKSIINLFRTIGYTFIYSFNLEEIMKIVRNVFNVRYCYIALYEDKSYPFTRSRLFMTYEQGNYKYFEDEGPVFPTNQILPDGIAHWAERYTMVIEPLYYANEHLGYIILNLGVREGTIYEALHSQLSIALKNELQKKELAKAEQRFRDLAHNTSDWLWEINRNGIFTYASSGVEPITGFKPEEMLGKSIFSYLEVQGRDFAQNLEKEMLEKKKFIYNLENWNEHKNGARVGLLLNSSPILNNSGELTGCRGVFHNITEKKLAEEKIKQMAYYDELTGLPNRNMCYYILEQSIKDDRKSKKKIIIMFLDLDGFKFINDTLGHSEGDVLLQEVAARIKQVKRKSDSVARLGGDEFVIIQMRAKTLDDGSQLADRILKTLEKPFTIKKQNYYISASIGIAIYPKDSQDVSSLLKNADTAMYKAKEKGKNQYVHYSSKMDQRRINRVGLESKMHLALERNEFQLLYQPIVNVKSGQTVSFEALLRWRSPDFGMVYPSYFIAIAEETGFINQIGDWVLATGMRQIKKWETQTRRNFTISINLSPRQLNKSRFFEEFLERLQAAKINPQHVQLEITENAVISSEITTISILKKLKDLGLSIALDDFGTGFSSLSYLKNLPINVVKIDKSFIDDIATNQESRAIVQAIIRMAQTLHLKVVAEGVENITQLETLKTFNCDEYQGYLFSNARQPEECLAFLEPSKAKINID